MLNNKYSEHQIQSLLNNLPTTTILRPANDPYTLASPFGGPESDIETYRRHNNSGISMPFPQLGMSHEDTEYLLLEQFKERKALLDRVLSERK